MQLLVLDVKQRDRKNQFVLFSLVSLIDESQKLQQKTNLDAGLKMQMLWRSIKSILGKKYEIKKIN